MNKILSMLFCSRLKKELEDERKSTNEWIKRYQNLEIETCFGIEKKPHVFVEYEIRGVYHEIMYLFTSIDVKDGFLFIKNENIKRELYININHIIKFDIIYE